MPLKCFLLCLVITITSSISAIGQLTIFSENMGAVNVAANTPVSSYTAFQNGAPVTHSGTAQVSASSPSTGTYTGASGGNNIFFTSNTTPIYSIGNIKIGGASSLRLRFGVFKNLQLQNGSNLLVTVVIDGSSYSLPLSTLPTGTGTQGWYAQDIPINVTGTTLSITFTSNATGANNWFRVDDVALTSATPLPVVFGAIEATQSNDLLSVTWPTESEINSDHFEVEASINGKDFTTIKSLPAKNGNTSMGQTYRADISLKDLASLMGLPFLLGCLGLGVCKRSKKVFLTFSCLVIIATVISCNKSVEDLETSSYNRLFIRIKQVDVDGSYQYSRIVQVVHK